MSIFYFLFLSQNNTGYSSGRGSIDRRTYRMASSATTARTSHVGEGPTPSTTNTTLAAIHKRSAEQPSSGIPYKNATSTVVAAASDNHECESLKSIIETIGEEFQEQDSAWGKRIHHEDDQTEMILNASPIHLCRHHTYDDDIAILNEPQVSTHPSDNVSEGINHKGYTYTYERYKPIQMPPCQPRRARISYSRSPTFRGIREVNFDGGTMDTWETVWDMPPPSLSLCCNNFIEDQDPEWRDVDYGEDIGPPPESFCQFVMQYDFKIFSREFSISNGNMDQR